jgi:3-methylcrotonyl-CoA carboxylase alpha subunit
VPVWEGLIEARPPTEATVLRDGADRILVIDDLVQVDISRPVYDGGGVGDDQGGQGLRAPINGKVAKVFVQEGQAVTKGDRVAVVEAMKMEHVLHAGRDGRIAKVLAKEGQQVTQGTLIASMEES